jgi:hypothetical protein
MVHDFLPWIASDEAARSVRAGCPGGIDASLGGLSRRVYDIEDGGRRGPGRRGRDLDRTTGSSRTSRRVREVATNDIAAVIKKRPPTEAASLFYPDRIDYHRR